MVEFMNLTVWVLCLLAFFSIIYAIGDLLTEALEKKEAELNQQLDELSEFLQKSNEEEFDEV